MLSEEKCSPSCLEHAICDFGNPPSLFKGIVTTILSGETLQNRSIEIARFFQKDKVLYGEISDEALANILVDPPTNVAILLEEDDGLNRQIIAAVHFELFMCVRGTFVVYITLLRSDGKYLETQTDSGRRLDKASFFLMELVREFANSLMRTSNTKQVHVLLQSLGYTYKYNPKGVLVESIEESIGEKKGKHKGKHRTPVFWNSHSSETVTGLLLGAQLSSTSTSRSWIQSSCAVRHRTWFLFD
jgi:hypothetical protein